MKRFLAVIAVLGVLAAPAVTHAEEKFLGTIVSGAGADTINTFVIVPGARLSIQCTAAAYVITDDLTAVTASRGVNLTASAFFLTKTNERTTVKQTISGQVSAVVRIAGPAAVTCSVWSRMGNE